MITSRSFAILGILLAAGLGLFGVQIGQAVKRGREFDRYLTVRGLSEREVKATLAIWPVRFAVTAEDLPSLQNTMESSRATVEAFLTEHEISATEISIGLPVVLDRADDRYGPERPHLPRYKAVATLVVRSANVDRVKRAIQHAGQLLEKGISLTAGEHGDRTEFLFDGINAIKPSMIQEATANARVAAAKFAEDSKARVGAIRRASQGALEIEDRDVASPERKSCG
jgi:hypothetical protein